MAVYDLPQGQLDQILAGQVPPSALHAIEESLRGLSEVSVDVINTAGNITPPSGVNLLVIDDHGVNSIDASGDPVIYAAGASTDIRLTGDAATTVVGGHGDLFFTGDPAASTVYGGEGNNFLFAGTNGGDHELHAGSGSSTVMGGSGADTLYGSTSPDGQALLIAGSGHNDLFGGQGSDTLIGGGHSLLVGGSGQSQLFGGSSEHAHDTLIAGTGDDQTLSVSEGNNRLYADTTNSGTNDTLIAGAGHDTLTGNHNATDYEIGAGSTSVQGGAGNDTVFVNNGSGHDTIDGGAGTNSVIFTGYTEDQANIHTSHGVTTITFDNSSQTETLSDVNSIYWSDGSETDLNQGGNSQGGGHTHLPHGGFDGSQHGQDPHDGGTGNHDHDFGQSGVAGNASNPSSHGFGSSEPDQHHSGSGIGTSDPFHKG
ncbi:calcium-binding protein [Methyloferula stellata]|uniref:calcium-binding protein n=1 Tax=Methyloferula stellata TaxID=876270 RepID=UPI00036C11C1|nr:calcium-binding protein [Methyloferula stellata]